MTEPRIHVPILRDRARRPWQPSDGDRRCQQCGMPNSCWWVEHKIWNAVMGGDGGILCSNCFMLEARDVGVYRQGAWQLYPPADLR